MTGRCLRLDARRQQADVRAWPRAGPTQCDRSRHHRVLVRRLDGANQCSTSVITDTTAWRRHSTSKSPRCDCSHRTLTSGKPIHCFGYPPQQLTTSSASRVHEPLLRAYSSLRRLVSDLATERRRAQVSRRLAACVRRHTARATRLQQQGARLRTHAPAFPGNEHVDCLADDLHWRCRRVLFSPQRHDTPAEARVSVPGHGVSPRHAAHHSAVL